MGNGLSVSLIVDRLHALQPDERSEALDNLFEQHDEIRTYVKSKHHRELVSLQQPQQRRPNPTQPHLQAIHIKDFIPDEERLSKEESSSWSRDISLFWQSSSFSFLPEETCCTPLRFIYKATIRVAIQNHQDCLRRRYLALFWFDYFKASYPKQKTAFDREYVDLGSYILGSRVTDIDATVSKLRELVKAGRKYCMLTAKFGDGILLTLPSSIGKTTLERKLPLDKKIFDTWTTPIVGSAWELQAKTGGIRDLGQRIRQSLLERCLAHHANRSARPSKKRKTNKTSAAVREIASTVPSITATSPVSPASPITPPTLPQVHRIYNMSGEECDTDQINRCYSVGNTSHSFHAASHPTDTLNATNIVDTSPSDYLSGHPGQNNAWPLPSPISGVDGLEAVVPDNGAGSESPRYEANYPTTQRQNVQESPQNLESIDRRTYSTSLADGVSQETFILPLFYTMGDHIPKVMLDRAVSPQPRWSEHGEFCEVTPHDAGLHKDLVDLLSDDTKLKQSIKELISLSRISEASRDGLQTYTCRDKSARFSYEQDRAYWIQRAFELWCYVFPRSQILDFSFGSVGRELLQVLQHLLQLYEKAGLEIPPGENTVEALVAASKFGGMHNRKYLLSIAADLQKDPEQTDLRAMIVHRESVLLRFSKKISDSQRAIQQFLERPFIVASPKSHCLIGLLHLSQAENWAYQFNYLKVYEEAQKWEPGDSPTSMELYVLRTKLIVLGQSYKGDGLFEDAMHAFEGCLAAMKAYDSERFLIKSNLADVYCELDYLNRKESVIADTAYLEKAEKIVGPEIEHLRSLGRTSKHFRRLVLSLIEIKIIGGQHKVAGSLIEELLAIYQSLTEHDAIDQVGHVRALIAWARISSPSDELMRWHIALHRNGIYNPSEDDVFTCGIIYLFISLAHIKLGDMEESWVSFIRASEIISRKKKQFLIPGFGTYLYSFARRELWSATGWQLPGMPP